MAKVRDYSEILAEASSRSTLSATEWQALVDEAKQTSAVKEEPRALEALYIQRELLGTGFA